MTSLVPGIDCFTLWIIISHFYQQMEVENGSRYLLMEASSHHSPFAGKLRAQWFPLPGMRTFVQSLPPRWVRAGPATCFWSTDYTKAKHDPPVIRLDCIRLLLSRLEGDTPLPGLLGKPLHWRSLWAKKLQAGFRTWTNSSWCQQNTTLLHRWLLGITPHAF